MPYFNGLIRLTARMQGNGEMANISVHVSKADPGVALTQATFDLLADRFVEWFNTTQGGGDPHKIYARPSVSFVSVAGLEYTQSGANGLPIPWEKSYAVPGTATGKQLPYQCALVITELTSLNNRRGRGRVYIPYLTDAAISNEGVMNTAQRDGILIQWDGFLESINALASPAVTCVVFSFMDGLGRPITSVRANTIIDTQRRRMKGLIGSSLTRVVTL